MANDDLAMQGAKASAAIVLNKSSWNVPVPASVNFMVLASVSVDSINSLASGRCGSYFKSIIFRFIKQLSTVATDALVLKHQAISIHSADTEV